MSLLRWCFLVSILCAICGRFAAEGLGVNWGLKATHPLPATVVVRLLRDNGLKKVKLFEAEPLALRALGHSGIEVMLGIPNEFLAPLASSVRAAEDWVAQNVSMYISKYGVDIRYVAVGNEPFLKTYKGMYEQTTFPALQNVQAALIKAGLSRDVKATVPLNADVYETSNGLPSGGDFRADIHPLMLSIVRFLLDNAAPLTINIYPFLSLYADPNFPLDYAFFSGGAAAPVVDGPISYTNVFDANFDTLIAALDKNGFASIPVIVGEVGWPTDGDRNANIQYARRFNQGLLDRVSRGQGTPRRSSPPEVYLFGLVDEDAKSIDPGTFERHWGLFYYDGTVKYALDLGGGRSLVPAKDVRYLDRRWCVMSPDASVVDSNLPESLAYACTYADCTSLGFGSSCGGLDVRSNASYAFNMYYQTANQQNSACQFSNLSVITTMDPSRDTCRFEIMIDTGRHERSTTPSSAAAAAGGKLQSSVLMVALLLTTLWSMS